MDEATKAQVENTFRKELLLKVSTVDSEGKFISIKDLSTKIGLSSRTLYRFLYHDKDLRMVSLLKIARFFDA